MLTPWGSRGAALVPPAPRGLVVAWVSPPARPWGAAELFLLRGTMLDATWLNSLRSLFAGKFYRHGLGFWLTRELMSSKAYFSLVFRTCMVVSWI